MSKDKQSRRSILKLMASGASLSVLNLANSGAVNAALSGATGSSGAAAELDDYKALVCVYLFGGNDSSNMVFPLGGESRAGYNAIRQYLAVPERISLRDPDNAEYFKGSEIIDFSSHHIEQPEAMASYNNDGLAFHPFMEGINQLYSEGAVAVQANVGSHDGDLFAHNSQQEAWMRGAPLSYSGGYGWAAKMLDKLVPENAVNRHLSNVSVFGNHTWSKGKTITPMSIGDSGHIPSLALYYHHPNALARKSIIEEHYQHHANQGSNHLVKEYANTFINADKQTSGLNEQLANVGSVGNFDGINAQFRRVAEMIKLQKNSNLENKRQIFFIGIPGFDTHKGQDRGVKNGNRFNRPPYHGLLLRDLSNAITAFYRSIEDMSLKNSVTTFTMSEFGRTLAPNVNGGTDHGWGGHQLIVGGAVKGGFYGKMPDFSAGSKDLGARQMLNPTTRTEEMFGGIANWFGLSDEQSKDIFPALNLEGVNAKRYFKS